MDLKELLKVIRYRWLSVVTIVFVAILLAFGWTKLQPVTFVANANGVVTSPVSGDSNSSVAQSFTTNSLISAKLPSYVQLGSLRSVAEYAISELNLDTSPEELVQRVTVSNPGETNFIRVSARASTPEDARNLAEIWVRGIEREVNLLETGKADTPGAIYLSPKDSASLPSKPSSPNMKLNLAMGFLAGLVTALAYTILRHVMDQKIRSVEDVEKLTKSVVLGSIPFEKSLTPEERLIVKPATGQTSNKLFAISESLRSLRTNIQFIDVDNPTRAVVVTSPLPGDGKSTLAANLALSIAMNDTPTILIDADLRRPMQSTIFNVRAGAGLTDVLAGRASLENVVHNVSNTGNLLLIGAGSVPPNPSEILGSARMKALVDELKEEAFVIIDAPPVIPVTDAAVIATRADGAILVTTAGKTTKDLLQKALSTLDKAKAKSLGVVLNRVPRRGMGAAYYGYQYKSSYYTSQGSHSAK